MSGRIHKVAIVGAGNITSLRHIPALKASGRAEILGIIDPKPERAREVAQRFGLPHSGTSLDEPWVEAAEAVTVGVPPTVHADVSINALRRGKHVLQEKPMAMSVAEGEAIRAAARESGRVFAIVHNFQFARSAMQLKALIARGELGQIRSVMGFQTSSPKRKLPVWAEQLPLGLFYDESPHLLYLFRAFAGDLRLREATAIPSHRAPATPHSVTAHFEGKIAPVFLHANFESSVSEWHMAVIGSEKVAVMDVFRDVLVVLPSDGGHLAGNIMRTSIAATLSHWKGVIAAGLLHLRGKLLYGNPEIVRRFLDAIENGRDPELISVDDALAVLRMQHEIVQAAGAKVSANEVAAAAS